MNEKIEVYAHHPADFTPKVEVAAIYVQVTDHMLLLQLSDRKPETGKWGVPAGKLEAGEHPIQAAQRELFEETGIQVAGEQLCPAGTLYVRRPEWDYIYHLFGLTLHTFPSISLSIEHCDYRWVPRENTETLPLMTGGKPGLDAYYRTL